MVKDINNEKDNFDEKDMNKGGKKSRKEEMKDAQGEETRLDEAPIGWPFPYFWGKRRSPHGIDAMQRDMFREFDLEFERMHRQMDQLFQDAMRMARETNDPEKGPIVYGWSMRVSPDGKPHFQQFGNTRGFQLYGGRTGEPKALEEGPQDQQEPGSSECNGEFDGDEADDILTDSREPLTDVIENKDKVCITSELPGVEKNDINLDAFPDRLTIKVETEQRKYFKEVPLPAEVEPDSIEASFKNGVLDVTIKKKRSEAKKGKRIPIE